LRNARKCIEGAVAGIVAAVFQYTPDNYAMRNAIFPPHLITVSVNMEHYASFPVIPACLAVPLLVYNLSKLPLAVIPVRDNASIGIHGAGNMTIGVLLLPSLCSLSDVPAPKSPYGSLSSSDFHPGFR